MKKLLIATLSLIALTLIACGSASQFAAVTPAGSLPIATQLIVGTFKLDGTGNAVTTEQAKELLPLWQVYSELQTSDTATQEEIDGLAAQLQETMTADQMQAIKDMNLTQQDVITVMQEQGAGVSSAVKDTSGTTTVNMGGGAPPDGGMPMGAPPEDGGGMPAGGQAASADSSASAGSASSPARSGQSSLLLEALIKYLQSK